MIYNIQYIKSIDDEIRKVRMNMESEYQIPIKLLEPFLNVSEKEKLVEFEKQRSDRYNTDYLQIDYLETVTKYYYNLLKGLEFSTLYSKEILDFLNSFKEIFNNDLQDKVKGKYVLGKNRDYIVATRLNYYKLVLRKVENVITDMGEHIQSLSGFDDLVKTLNTLVNNANDKDISRSYMLLKERNENYVKTLFNFKYNTDLINTMNSIPGEYKVVGSSDLVTTIEVVNGNSKTILDNIIDVFNVKFEMIETACNAVIESCIDFNIDPAEDGYISIDIDRLILLDKVMKSFFEVLNNSEFINSIKYLYNKANESYSYINKLVSY